MKKLFLFIVDFGLFFVAHAQFGIRAGLSFENFSDTNFNPKLGFHAGGYNWVLDLSPLNQEFNIPLKAMKVMSNQLE
ncbi:MAG: hypothetical protein ACI9UV_000955 [Algoriphagus sp.]|jgi:hypothetical protein